MLICPFTLLDSQSSYPFLFFCVIHSVHFPTSIRLFVTFFASLSSVLLTILFVCSFPASMFYICEQHIFILVVYSTIFPTECMLMHLGVMQQTNQLVSFSGYVLIDYNIDIQYILLFLCREYVIFSLMFNSHSDP